MARKRELKRLLNPPFASGPRVLVAVFGFLVGVLFLPWSMYSSGTGRIMALDPSERVQEITAPVGGFVQKWHVREGTQVKQGQPIVNLIDNDPSLMDRMDTERRAAEAAVEASQLALHTAKLNSERQENLFKEGLASRKEFEKARIEASKLSVELAKSQAVLAKAQVQVARQNSQQVVAPRDGTVLRIRYGEGNHLIKAGDGLVAFAPTLSSPAVEAWISGDDLRWVRKGESARVQFEGWPAVQIPGWPSVSIGTFKGTVALVDYASSYQGKFRILIVPGEERWPSSDFLRLNANARAVVALGNTLIGIEIWRKLNNFPPSSNLMKDELSEMLAPKKGQEKADEDKADK